MKRAVVPSAQAVGVGGCSDGTDSALLVQKPVLGVGRRESSMLRSRALCRGNEYRSTACYWNSGLCVGTHAGMPCVLSRPFFMLFPLDHCLPLFLLSEVAPLIARTFCVFFCHCNFSYFFFWSMNRVRLGQSQRQRRAGERNNLNRWLSEWMDGKSDCVSLVFFLQRSPEAVSLVCCHEGRKGNSMDGRMVARIL